jgi:hypothetical protein
MVKERLLSSKDATERGVLNVCVTLTSKKIDSPHIYSRGSKLRFIRNSVSIFGPPEHPINVKNEKVMQKQTLFIFCAPQYPVGVYVTVMLAVADFPFLVYVMV